MNETTLIDQMEHLTALVSKLEARVIALEDMLNMSEAADMDREGTFPWKFEEAELEVE